MIFQGRLIEALKNKKIILFAGAGVGQAAGLYGTAELRDYIYEEAKQLNYSEPNDQPFERLAARLQNHPSFNHAWLTRVVSEYFCKPSNYTTLDDHIKLLTLNCIDSIFTTNYDIVFEQAAAKACLDVRVRALDSVTAANSHITEDTINCYKLHGCADSVSRITHAQPLVISRKDWSHATRNRREILKELTAKVNSGCIVIFAGFNLSNGDNSDISRAVFEGNGDILRTDFWQSNSCYALVRNPSKEDVDVYREDFSCEVIRGDFSTLVSELETACKSLELNKNSIEENISQISFLSLTCSKKFTKSFLDDNSDSFIVWHDQTLSESHDEECTINSWHEPPSIKMLANNRYIQRDVFDKVIILTKKTIEHIYKHRRNEVISIIGGRGSGKSVILLQLAKYCYDKLKQPVIFLKEDAYIEIQSINESSLIIQGWENKALDVILQPFFDEISSVPILIADNQPHRRLRAEQLAAYLSNHGKPCLLIISDYVSSDRLRYSNNQILIPNILSDNDTEQLFDRLAIDRNDMLERRDILLNRAKNECNKDILIIMYEWLDKNFRPFQKIISDSASLISKSNLLRQVYILIASFHVSGFKPSLSLIVRAADYPADEVLNALKGGDFGLHFSSTSMVLYRHTLISNRLLAEMGVSPKDQVKAIISCINKASASDVRFFKGFLEYLFSLGNPEFTVTDIELIKESTESNSVFKNEWDLHHKYAAYLARDAQDIIYYQEARRYCDMALSFAVDDTNRSNIYHTLGNIEYKEYQISYFENPKQAEDCFNRAVEKFELSKQLRTFQTEHAYVTHIDFINFQLKEIDNKDLSDDEKKLSELKASKFAIYWEALKVVDKDQQRYLSDRIRNEDNSVWDNLAESVINHIKENAYQQKPNKILFDCYIDQCLIQQSQESRKEINSLYNLHKNTRDPDILIPLLEGMKRAFLLDARSRSNILRSIATELFDPTSPITNQTRARGIRLLAIDSFVSGQYDYLSKHVLGSAAALYQEIRPRFLNIEYILPLQYYKSKGVADPSALTLFLDRGPDCFYSVRLADVKENRFNRHLNRGQTSPRYTTLSTPSLNPFFLKVPTVEITSHKSSFVAKFIIQYSAFGMSGNLQRPSKS